MIAAPCWIPSTTAASAVSLCQTGGERTKLQGGALKAAAHPLQTHEMLFDAHSHNLRLGGVPGRVDNLWILPGKVSCWQPAAWGAEIYLAYRRSDHLLVLMGARGLVNQALKLRLIPLCQLTPSPCRRPSAVRRRKSAGDVTLFRVSSAHAIRAERSPLVDQALTNAMERLQIPLHDGLYPHKPHYASSRGLIDRLSVDHVTFGSVHKRV